MFEFFCPRCGKRLRVPGDWAGRAARCPFCAATIGVPILGDAAEELTAYPAEEAAGETVDENYGQPDVDATLMELAAVLPARTPRRI